MQVFFICFLVFANILLGDCASYGQENAGDELEVSADYVWVNRNHGTSTLLHSRQKDGKWSPAETIIVKNSGLITTPSIIRTKEDGLWVFWSVLHGEESMLYYRRYDGAKWSEPDLIFTEMEFNGGASVVLDEHEVPWIFWVGNDGRDDDIYWSKWEEGGWSYPLIINEEDNTPDILPFAGRDNNGKIWVIWSGFNGTRYQYYFSHWQGNHWSMEVVFTPDNPVFETVNERFHERKSLPVEVGEKATGFIDIQDGKKALRSLRLLPAELMQLQ